MRLGLNGRYRAARLTGVQRFAHGLCTALAERVESVLFLPANAPDGQVPAHVRVVRGVLRGHAWEQLELPRLARAAGVDLLFNPANSGPWSGPAHGLMVHDVLPLTHAHWFARRYALFQKHALRAALGQARHVFTSTHHTAGQLAQVAGVSRERVHVITQGLHPFDKPATAVEVAALRTRLGLDVPYFLFVGVGDPRKNLELLLRAAAKLQPGRRFQVVAVGQRSSRIHARGAALHTELPWLRIIDALSDADLRALYSGALALCFPSREEGFGRPPLEALACGTPALAGNYPAAHEVLGTAVPILDHDVDLWVAALSRLLDEPEERVRLLQRAASLALTSFDWGRAAEQVLHALHGEDARLWSTAGSTLQMVP